MIHIPAGTYAELQKKLGGKQMFGASDCPFCRELDDTRLLWKGQHWAIIWNHYPYIIGGKHIMLIPIRHITISSEMTPEECRDLPDAYRFIKDFFGDDAYFSFTRESFAERSVEHLHSHFIHGKIPRKSCIELLKAQGFEVDKTV